MLKRKKEAKRELQVNLACGLMIEEYHSWKKGRRKKGCGARAIVEIL